ncbi:MAG: 2-dehydro-3-deoxy-6-phosphogalactonate aldolase [Sphingobium sp.]|nr:2-dehydro-3-deoxy-6-phosphogalactonate aldolase [Sphingobium sp.]
MTQHSDFAEAFARCPLVAILRGVRPDEVEAIGEALVGAGFSLIEVPLNSPDPLVSIERLARSLEGRALVGAGTVLTAGQVAQVAEAGGRIIVSPNSNVAVIGATVAAGMASLPGCFTPTEAFGALAAGAHALKFFPAEAMSPAVLKAQAAVLPRDVPKLVVGGITPENMGQWTAVGAAGFGLGSALYKPGMDAEAVAANARAFVDAWRALA